MWTITSPDGRRVERYIVEFECSVGNIKFAEKYMSVSASGGTGRVVTSVSCFGGLGQLYRVKVWAVSGPNISQVLVCIPDGQCMEEGTGVCSVYYEMWEVCNDVHDCTVSDYCCGMVSKVSIICEVKYLKFNRLLAMHAQIFIYVY